MTAARATYYPVFLDLRQRRAVVIGAGAVAAQKVQGLLEAGAHVTVVSPVISAALESLAASGAIAVERRSYRPGDLARAVIAVAATDNRKVNAAIWREAEIRGTLLNAVDDVDHCHFIAPSVHRQGDIAVAVSSGGKCPALAVRLREKIAPLVTGEHATLADFLGAVRPEVAELSLDAEQRRSLWYAIVDSDVPELVRRKDLVAARRRVRELARLAGAGMPATNGAASRVAPADRGPPNEAHSNGRRRRGVVYLVGAGPGDPGLITRRGMMLLRSADVVVHDRLVQRSLLRAARHDALLLDVGKRGGGAGHSARQMEINALLVEHARRGRLVVRLKGGDPFVFGRGAEECDALRAAAVPCAIVPGVTSATAAAAAVGIPVTHRGMSAGFAVVTAREAAHGSSLDWSALARLPTIVVLMGLRRLEQVTARLIEGGARPSTRAAVISRATLRHQCVVTGTLASIADGVRAAGLRSPATLVVGDVVRYVHGDRRSRVPVAAARRGRRKQPQ
ncbi:MAG: siroheme synthase CysG [Gemmatimonadaceae bacterium]